MKSHNLILGLVLGSIIGMFVGFLPGDAHAVDIRGVWVGKAQGPIFSAEGNVTITRQKGEDIIGVVEGGNFLGRARFTIRGKIRGAYIFGEKEGNVFQGAVYADGTIRGAVKATDGNTYRVFLRRPYPSWGGYPYRQW